MLNKIKDRIGNFPGKIGISYLDLTTGYSCFAGNCDVFPSSGISKLLVLIEVFRELEEGKLKWEDRYLWDRKPKGAALREKNERSYGILDFLHAGLELTLEDLVKLMVVVSDNSAFNILLEKVGIGAVNEAMESLGFTESRVNRYFFDKEKMERGIDNYHSVREMTEIFKRMYQGQLVSGKASKQMIDLLLQHQRGNIISYFFEEGFPVAHQSGFDVGMIHDVGIAFANKPFILCMSAADVDTGKAEGIMRDVALMSRNYSQAL